VQCSAIKRNKAPKKFFRSLRSRTGSLRSPGRPPLFSFIAFYQHLYRLNKRYISEMVITGLDHHLTRLQMRLPIPDRGCGINANDFPLDNSSEDKLRSIHLHASSYIAAAAHCHDGLAGGHASLRPFTHLHPEDRTTRVLCPGQGRSFCASLWRGLCCHFPEISPNPTQDHRLVQVSADTIIQQVIDARAVISQRIRQDREKSLVQAIDTLHHRACTA
jgi:hypothetical protein